MTDVAEVGCPEFVATWVRSGQWLSLGAPVPDSVLAAAQLPGLHQVHVDLAAIGLVADALRTQPQSVIERMVYVPQVLEPGPEAAVGHADQLGLPVLVQAPDSLTLSGPRVVPFEAFGETGAVLVYPAERLTGTVPAHGVTGQEVTGTTADRLTGRRFVVDLPVEPVNPLAREGLDLEATRELTRRGLGAEDSATVVDPDVPSAPWYIEHGATGAMIIQAAGYRNPAEIADRVVDALPDRAPNEATEAESHHLREAVRARLADLLGIDGHAEAPLPATPDQQAAARLVELSSAAANTERWDDLLREGWTGVIDGRLVWIKPRLHDAKPVPTTPTHDQTYDVSFGSTAASVSGETPASRALSIGSDLLLRLPRKFQLMTIGLPFDVESSTSDASTSSYRVISGRKIFFNGGPSYASGLAVDVFVDGRRWGETHQLGSDDGMLVVKFPEQYVGRDQRPRPGPVVEADGTLTPGPETAREVLTAIDYTPAVARLHRQLRDGGLPAHSAATVAQRVGQRLLNERTSRGRSRWLLSGGDMTERLAVPIGTGRSFEGYAVVELVVRRLQRIGDTEGVAIRDDLGVVRDDSRHQSGSYTLSFAPRLLPSGLTASASGNDRGGIGPVLSAGWGKTTAQAVGDAAMNHTVLVRSAEQARYAADVSVNVKLESTTHRIPWFATAVKAEFGVPTAEAEAFERHHHGAPLPAEVGWYGTIVPPVSRPTEVTAAEVAERLGPPRVDAPQVREPYRPETAAPREPLIMAARRGDGPGTTIGLPGGDRVAAHVLEALGVALGSGRGPTAGSDEWAEARRLVAVRYGLPALEGDPARVRAGIHTTFSIGGRQYQVLVTAQTREWVGSSTYPMSVNNRAMSTASTSGSVTSDQGLHAGVSANAVFGYDGKLRGQLSGLSADGTYERSTERGGARAVKSYRRTETTGDVVQHDYLLAYEITVRPDDGPPIRMVVDGPDVQQQVVVPVEHLPEITPTMAQVDQVGVQVALHGAGPLPALPEEMVPFDREGVAGVYPRFAELHELPAVVARLYGQVHGKPATWFSDPSNWPAELWARDLAVPTELSANLANLVDGEQRWTIPLGADGDVTAVAEISATVHQVSHLSSSERVEIEQYAQAASQFDVTEEAGGQASLGAGGGVLYSDSPGDTTDSTIASNSGGGTLVVHGSVHQDASAASGVGSIDITRATYKQLVHSYRAGLVRFTVKLTGWRSSGPPIVRQATVDLHNGLEFQVPNRLAHDLGLPEAVAVQPPTQPRDELDPQLGRAASHVEKLRAERPPLQFILDTLVERGVLPAPGQGAPKRLSTALSRTFSLSALESQAFELFGGGVQESFVVPGGLLGTGYLSVRVKASLGAVTSERSRPEVDLTLRTQALDSAQESASSGWAAEVNLAGRGRGTAGEKKGIGGGGLRFDYGRGASQEQGAEHTTKNIFRYGTKGAHELNNRVHFTVEMRYSFRMPLKLQVLGNAVRSALLPLASGFPALREIIDPQRNAWELTTPLPDAGAVRRLLPAYLTGPAGRAGQQWEPLLAAPEAGDAGLNDLVAADPTFIPIALPITEQFGHDLIQALEPGGSGTDLSAKVAPTNSVGQFVYRHLLALTGFTLGDALVDPERFVSEPNLRPRVQQLLDHRYRVPGTDVRVGIVLNEVAQLLDEDGMPVRATVKARRYAQNETKPVASNSFTSGWEAGLSADGAAYPAAKAKSAGARIAGKAGRRSAGTFAEDLTEVVERNTESRAPHALYRYGLTFVVHLPDGRTVPVRSPESLYGQSRRMPEKLLADGDPRRESLALNGRAFTRARLSSITNRVVESVGGSQDELALLGALAGALYPAGVRPLPGPQHMVTGMRPAVDDFRTIEHWSRPPSWEAVEEALRRSGPGSTALVLAPGVDGRLRSLAVHRTSDERNVWITPRAAEEARLVTDDGRSSVVGELGNPVESRILLVDPGGGTIENRQLVLPPAAASKPARSGRDSALAAPPIGMHGRWPVVVDQSGDGHVTNVQGEPDTRQTSGPVLWDEPVVAQEPGLLDVVPGPDHWPVSWGHSLSSYLRRLRAPSAENDVPADRGSGAAWRTIEWMRDTVNAATTDSALATLLGEQPGTGPRGLTVEVEIGLRPVPADETAQAREIREAREADLGGWLTAQVYRHLNVGLTGWAQREGKERVLPQVRVRHSVVRTASVDFVRLRGLTHEPVPGEPHRLTGQWANILRGRAIDVALDASSRHPTEQAVPAIDALAREVADQAVLRHLIVHEFFGKQIVKLAPKETTGPYVELAATYDEANESPDDAEEAILYVADPFERSLRTAIGDRITALTGVRADPEQVQEIFSRVGVQHEIYPVFDGSEPAVQLGYVIPPAPSTRVDDLAGPKLDYLSRWRLSPLSSEKDGWWRAHDPMSDADGIVAALPGSAFRAVDAEIRDIGERSGRPQLFSLSGTDVKYDVARVEVQDGALSGADSAPRFLRVFHLRIHLAAQEDVSVSDVEAYAAHARDAVRQEINGRFRLPGGDQFHLDVRFTDDAKDAHHVIRVPKSGGMDAGTWPRDVLREPVQQVRDSVLHEMLHLLGLPDEYVASGGPDRNSSVLRRAKRATNDPRGPRRPDLPPALMQDIGRAGGDHIIAPRYLWEIAFVQESHATAPHTVVRRSGGTIDVTAPTAPGPAPLLERMFAEHPAVTTGRLADNLRYEHDVTAALLAWNPDRVEGYTYVMLPATVAERLVAGERFPLRGQSDDFEFEDVPDGYTVVVVHSTSLLLHSPEGELRFVLPSPDAPLVLRQSWPNGGGYFEQEQPSEPEADQVAGVLVDLSDLVEPAVPEWSALRRPPTGQRVLRKPEPTVARPRGGVPRHVPDRRMDQPTLTSLTPTRRRRPAPDRVTPSRELSEDPAAVFRRVAALPRSLRNEYRTWADEVVEARNLTGAVAALTPVRRAELADRMLDLLRNNDHRQQYEAEQVAGDFVDRFLRDGPPPLPTPLFGRDLQAEFVLAPGATDLSWPDHAELDAFVRSVVAETSRRVEDGLPPLRLRAAVGPGRAPGFIDRLAERVPGLDRGLGRRTAEARSTRLTETLTDLLAAHDQTKNGVAFTPDAVRLVSTASRDRGRSHDWVRVWVGAPAGEQEPGLVAAPPEQLSTADPSRLAPATIPDGDAAKLGTGDSHAMRAYREFRAHGLPRLSAGGPAASVADELAWTVGPGALRSSAAAVLERAGLRALVPANDGYLAAVTATLTHRRLPGGAELAQQPPEMFHLAMAGMLEAELSGVDAVGRRLGLDTADDTARQQVVDWFAEGLPPSRVPETIRTALRLEDSASGRTRAMVTLMSHLVERPIDVLLPDGGVHRTGDPDPARDALLLVATEDGQLLATVPRAAVPALVPAGADRIVVATEFGTEGSMPSDVATFDGLHLFLRHLVDAEDLPLPASEHLAASLPGALHGVADPVGDGLAEALREVRAAVVDRGEGATTDPAELTVLPPGSTSVNRLTDFQIATLEEARLGAVWTRPGPDSVFEALRLSARHGQQRMSGLAEIPAPALRHNIAAVLLADLVASGGVAAPLLGLAPETLAANRESVLRWISRLATPGAPVARQTPRRIAQVLAQMFAVRVDLIHPTHVESVPATESVEPTDAPPLRLLVTADGHVMPAVPVADRYDAIRRPADATGALADATATGDSRAAEGESRPVRAPEPGSIVHTIGTPHQTLPHLDEAVANIIAAAHVRGVTMSPNEQAMLPSRLLANYRELVGGGHLVQVGPVEVLVRIEPTDATLAPNLADRRYAADEVDDWDAEGVGGAHLTDPEARKKLFHATQTTSSGFNTGGASLSNSGQAGALRGAVGLGVGVGLGPGVLEVARAGVTISGTANRVDRTTVGVQDAESGRVQDDRIDSTLVSYTPNWSVRTRPDDSTAWADLPTTWSSAAEHPDGQERLEVWVPDHYLQQGEAQVQAMRPTDEGLGAEFARLSRQIPDTYFATGLTGLPELYDRIVAELRTNGLSLDPNGPERRELRQALWKLSFNLDTAINNRQPAAVTDDEEARRRRVQANAGGYPITLHDRAGHAVAVVVVQTERDADAAITRVGATSDKSHIERVSTAIGAHSGSFGLTNESEVRASGELNFMPLPGLVLGPSVGVGWTWSNSDSVSGGHTGIWVHVSRYTGRTAGYRVGLRHKAVVHVANRVRSTPTTTADVRGEALLRLPEPAAFAHGFPVDTAALRQPPAPSVATVEYAPGLVNDGSTPASELQDVVLPRHVAQGRGIGMGLATVDDNVAEELRGEVLSELARTGYVPPRRFPFATQPTLGTNAHIGSDSRLANLSLIDKFVSTNAFSAFYDQLHQDGLSFTLRGDPRGHRRHAARVTIRAVQDPEELKRTDERGNSTLLQRRTGEYHLVNLAIGSSSGSYTAGGRRGLALGSRFGAGVKLMQTWGVAAEYSYAKGATQTAGQTLSEPQLLEYPGDVDEFRLPSRYQVTVDYEYKPRQQSSTWQSGPVDGAAAVLLVPSINTRLDDQEPMTHPTDVSVLDQAVIYYADTHGLLDAARRLQPDLSGPGQPGDEELSIFTGTAAVRSYFKEILHDEYQTENLFRSGLVRHKQGSLGVHGALGASEFVGATSDQFTAGLIKLYLSQASHGHSRDHGIKFSVDHRTRVVTTAANLSAVQSQPSAWVRYGTNRSGSSSRTGGVEILDLDFHNMYAFLAPVDFTVTGTYEAHAKLLPTSVRRPPSESVDGRQMIYLLPENEALKRYGAGAVPISHTQLLNALRRWKGGDGDSEKKLELHHRDVRAVIERMEREARAWPDYPHHQELKKLRTHLIDRGHDALSSRLAALGFDSIAELTIPDYLLPNGPTSLGHSGVHSLTFRRSAEKSVRPFDIVHEAIEAAVPGLVGARRSQWTPNAADRGPMEVWWRRLVGEKPVIGRLVGGLDYLETMFAGTRLKSMSDDLMQGVQFYLVNKVAGALTEVVEVKLRLTLATPPQIFDFVPKTGIERYGHAYNAQSSGTSVGFSGVLAPLQPAFAGAEDTANTSGGLGLGVSGGRQTGIVQTHQSTQEQTVYDWVAHYLARADVSLSVEVNRLDMPNRPLSNLLLRGARPFTGQSAPLRREHQGELVLKLPHSVAEARRLSRLFDRSDLRALPKLPPGTYIHSVFLADALAAGWGLLGRMFGPEANDVTFRSSVTLPALLSPGHLSNFLHQAVAGQRHTLTDDMFLPGHSSTRASLHLVGDLHHIEVLFQLDGSGTGRYAKDQAGTTATASRSHLRVELSTSVNQNQAVSVNDTAQPDAPWGTHTGTAEPKFARVAPRGDGSGQTVNYRTEQHVKQQGRLYLVRMRFKGRLEAERFEQGDPSRSSGSFVSDRFTGAVYAKLFEHEIADLRTRLKAVPLSEPATEPERWPRPDDHTPRHDLDQLANVPGRAGHDQLTVAEHISNHIRDHARTNQVVVSSSAARRAYHRLLLVEEWAVRHLGEADPEAVRLRRDVAGRYDLMWKINESEPTPAFVDELRTRTARLIELVREREPTLVPPVGLTPDTYDPLLTARLIAHNLRRYVHLDLTEADGTVTSRRIDPAGHLASGTDHPPPDVVRSGVPDTLVTPEPRVPSPVLETRPTPVEPLTDPVVLPPGSRAELDAGQLYWVGPQPSAARGERIRSAAAEVDGPVVYLGSARPGLKPLDADVRDVGRLVQQLALRKEQPVVVTTARLTPALRTMAQTYGFSFVHLIPKSGAMSGGLAALPSAVLSQQSALTPVWQVVGGNGDVEEQGESLRASVLFRALELARPNGDSTSRAVGKLLLAPTRNAKLDVITAFRDELTGQPARDDLRKIVEQVDGDPWFRKFTPLLGELGRSGRAEFVLDFQELTSPVERNSLLIGDVGRGMDVGLRVGLIEDSGHQVAGAATALRAVDLMFADGLPAALDWVQKNSAELRNDAKQHWVDAISGVAAGHESRAADFQALAEEVYNC
ncbi:hypothetical protein [Micromonospora sp. NPDC005172]|uniref:hypothetical protein n=1 Tax=Micromonospora sp. NPDC005172 TaxID=3156867 RepID=UPI00339FC23B